MAYDEVLADRIRARLLSGAVTEQRMMGGLVFMVDGHMCCGVSGRGLLVRVGPDGMADALRQPDAAPMRMGARTMAGFVRVTLEGVEPDVVLDTWIARALGFVATLPVRSSTEGAKSSTRTTGKASPRGSPRAKSR